MARRTFSDFQLLTTPTTGDFIVGYNQSGTTETRIRLNNLSGLIKNSVSYDFWQSYSDAGVLYSVPPGATRGPSSFAPYIWTIPPWSTMQTIIMIGAGGGGGSGRVGEFGSISSGGAGGGSGAVGTYQTQIPGGTVIEVLPGSGGSGGSGVGFSGIQNGNPGTAGSMTRVLLQSSGITLMHNSDGGRGGGGNGGLNSFSPTGGTGAAAFSVSVLGTSVAGAGGC